MLSRNVFLCVSKSSIFFVCVMKHYNFIYNIGNYNSHLNLICNCQSTFIIEKQSYMIEITMFLFLRHEIKYLQVLN